MSPHSRNRHVGEQVATGRSVVEIVSQMRMVAEVDAVVNAGRTARDGFHGLMRVAPTSETHEVV